MTHSLTLTARGPEANDLRSGPLGVLLSPPALDVRLMTALQVLQVLQQTGCERQTCYIPTAKAQQVPDTAFSLHATACLTGLKDRHGVGVDAANQSGR